MKLHELKIEHKYLIEVYMGRKTFELRKNDRDYQVGDLIHFVKTDGFEYFGHSKDIYEIIYVLKGVVEYGLDKDYCILGIKKLKIEE